jgi:histidinol-phosphate aminotransferase
MYSINQNIINLNPYKPGKPIKEVERELGIKNPIKLASNENAWGTSEKAKKAMQESINEINLYPDGNSFYLRKAISFFNGVDEEEIITGNGSNEILTTLMRIFLNEKNNLVIGEYAFAIYQIVAKSLGCKINKAKTNNYKNSYENLINSCDENTALMIVDNPNNPTGTYINKAELNKLIEFTNKNKIILVIDEAYLEYVRANDYETALESFKKYDNLVITRTFSKAYGLCGLRIGYAVCHKWISDLYNKVRDPFNVNLMAQNTALAALKDQEFIKSVVKKTHAGIEFFYKEFKELNLNYIKSETNFILVNVKEDGNKFFKKLMQKGVIVRPMTGYGFKNHIRINVGKEEENKIAINKFKELING